MNDFPSSVNLTDSGGGDDNCIYGARANRFDDSTQYETTTPNTFTSEASFPGPAMEGCVECTGAGNSGYHFFHVLHVR